MVYIIVVNWNGWRDSIGCIESLLHLTYQMRKVILVDNGSTDSSIHEISSWARRNNILFTIVSSADIKSTERADRREDLIIIESDKNLGYAGGNNLGITYALANAAEYLWILNNDTVVAADSLEQLTRMQEGRTDVILGARLLDYLTGAPQVSGANIRPWRFRMGFSDSNQARTPPDDASETCYDFVTGASIFATNAIFRKVGGFNEDYFLYAEEGDWMLRAKRHNIDAKICWECKVAHKGSNSAGPASCLQEYYMTRNSLYLFSEHYPHYVIWQLLAYPCWRVMAIIVRNYKNKWGLVRSVYMATLHYLVGKKGAYDIK
jgi:GT2 family glycosyltransferase